MGAGAAVAVVMMTGGVEAATTRLAVTTGTRTAVVVGIGTEKTSAGTGAIGHTEGEVGEEWEVFLGVFPKTLADS